MSEPLTLGEILGQVLAPRPKPVVERAAEGDGYALSQFARGAYADAIKATGAERVALLGQAVAFGRLAMVHGDPADAHATVSILGELAAACRSLGAAVAGDQYEGQGVLLAELLAEDGDDEMADLIAANASQVTAGAFQEARRLHGLVLAGDHP